MLKLHFVVLLGLGFLGIETTTLPETNSSHHLAPENRPLEKEISIGNHHFWGRAVSFGEVGLGCVETVEPGIP